MVTVMFVMVPRAEASAVRINEVLDTEAEIVDPAEVKTGCTEPGHVEFRNVTFSYPGAEEPAISNISFAARPGEVTALIGGTGAGKSTLINLIPRFYDVDDGCVLVDGVDVREMRQQALREKIGFVPQTPVLFSGTIADNIRYGKSDASDEEIRHAARIAQADDFISGLPDGYDAPVAQGGTNLSGGQKQRLSIARALVRKPGIYILDDSFSALDFKTDARLRAALKQETAHSTVIIVAQRVSTVMDANRIIVLDEGREVGMGTHRELLDSCPVYREIVLSQLSLEEIA
jgi:ATP-binding cassette subfamily B protein